MHRGNLVLELMLKKGVCEDVDWLYMVEEKALVFTVRNMQFQLIEGSYVTR
jgi:hypothetical protein